MPAGGGNDGDGSVEWIGDNASGRFPADAQRGSRRIWVSADRIGGDWRGDLGGCAIGAQGNSEELISLRAAVGSPERADAEVEKHQRQAGEHEKPPMVRPMGVAGAGRPNSPPYKNRHKDQKKNAGNLEPEDSTHAAEGTQKTAYAAIHGLPGLNRRARCRLYRCGAVPFAGVCN